MGSCFSSATSATQYQPTAARVIDLDGSLREHSVPAKASDVLCSAGPSCFLCNSDSLFFDSNIPPIGSNESLQPGQIYFVLPITMLERSLSCSDMAALAVKASSALASGRGRRRRIIQVMPVAEICEVVGGHSTYESNSITHEAQGRRPGMASLRHRRRLNPIPEVPE